MIKKALIIAAILFAILFTGRLISILLTEVKDSAQIQVEAVQEDIAQSAGGVFYSGKRNYASSKLPAPPTSGQISSDFEQKYERIASLRSTTTDFDADREKTQAAVDGAGAFVQEENAQGLQGQRVLSLTIGVRPEAFESLVEALKGIGTLEFTIVTKADRTADYRALEAKRLSLEKTTEGLRGLRGPGAALADRVALETKILEIEAEIQGLGVSLGDFAEDASLCTIKISLAEREGGMKAGRVLDAIFEALSWSALFELGIALIGAAAAFLAWLGLIIAEKARGLARK